MVCVHLNHVNLRRPKLTALASPPEMASCPAPECGHLREPQGMRESLHLLVTHISIIFPRVPGKFSWSLPLLDDLHYQSEKQSLSTQLHANREGEKMTTVNAFEDLLQLFEERPEWLNYGRRRHNVPRGRIDKPISAV